MNTFGTAAILAGGQSTRMGQDKKHLKISGDSLLQSIVEQIRPIFSEVIIIGCEQNEIAKLKGIDATYPDALEFSASLTGIYTALIHGKSKYVYVTACDMPNYDDAYICHMMALLNSMPEKEGCVTRFKEWIEPFNAFYARELVQNMETFLKKGRKSVFHFLDAQNMHYIDEKNAREYSPDWTIFRNLNTPEDLKNHLAGEKNDDKI